MGLGSREAPNAVSSCDTQNFTHGAERLLSLLMQAQCQLRILDGGPINGFVGFFDSHFRGSPENPVDCEVPVVTLQPYFLPQDEIYDEISLCSVSKNYVMTKTGYCSNLD